MTEPILGIGASRSEKSHSQSSQGEIMKMSSNSGILDFISSKFRNARDIRFFIIVGGIFLFFGVHNFMQEMIMDLPGFKIGIFLGYLEVLGVTFFAFAERLYSGEVKVKMQAKWKDYIFLCMLLMTSSACSNMALGYINYPTKVVFRSCKLVPTMLIAVSYNHRQVQAFQFVYGGFISLGMVLFAAADFNSYPNFNMYGIGLVSISVVADAFLPNFQEKIFEQGASRAEVTFFTNALTLLFMSISLAYTGDLQAAVAFSFSQYHYLVIMLTYTVTAYVAITCHMTLVKEFGGINTVLVGNARKAMTIVLSFLIFPKAFSWLYVFGGVFVFGSLIGIEYTKEQLKREKRARSVIDLPMMSLAPSSQPQAEVGNQANSMEMDYEGDDTHGYRCNSQSIQQLASKL